MAPRRQRSRCRRMATLTSRPPAVGPATSSTTAIDASPPGRRSTPPRGPPSGVATVTCPSLQSLMVKSKHHARPRPTRPCRTCFSTDQDPLRSRSVRTSRDEDAAVPRSSRQLGPDCDLVPRPRVLVGRSARCGVALPCDNAILIAEQRQYPKLSGRASLVHLPRGPAGKVVGRRSSAPHRRRCIATPTPIGARGGGTRCAAVAHSTAGGSRASHPLERPERWTTRCCWS
jgi:hypothetical protein